MTEWTRSRSTSCRSAVRLTRLSKAGGADSAGGNSICGAVFFGSGTGVFDTLRTNRPVRASARTTKVTVAGLFTGAACATAALKIITEDSIKQFLILMFYFSVTELTPFHFYNVIISAWIALGLSWRVAGVPGWARTRLCCL